MATRANASSTPPFTVKLAPNPLGLADCQVSVGEVTAEGEDDGGFLRITVKYEVGNPTDVGWEYLLVRTQLIGSAGQVIDESGMFHEQTVCAGESSELEDILEFKARLLGDDPSGTSIVVNVLAGGFVEEILGEIAIPDEHLAINSILPTEVGGVLRLLGGSVWKTDPDKGEGCINVRLLVQNLTDEYIPRVCLIAEIVDKSGRRVTGAGCWEEFFPANIGLIAGSGFGKDRQFKGAKAMLGMRAYLPLAAGSFVFEGAVVSAAQVT
jgi:hypothetical protein